MQFVMHTYCEDEGNYTVVWMATIDNMDPNVMLLASPH